MESLGLSNEDVPKYILSQQVIIREERATEQVQRRLKLESQKEAERTKLGLLKFEADKDKSQNEHELELEDDSSHVSAAMVNVHRPSSPVYHDCGNISSYKVRFECVAKLLGIDPESYAICLGSLLIGTAINIPFT